MALEALEFRITMKNYILLILTLIFSSKVFAGDYDKYCEYGENSSKIYILSHSIFSNEQAKEDFLSKLSDFINTR